MTENNEERMPNDLGEFMRWASEGPKENEYSPQKRYDVAVATIGDGYEEFENVNVIDIGSRLIVGVAGGLVSTFPEHAVIWYTFTPHVPGGDDDE